jgi:hypothetical protein
VFKRVGAIARSTNICSCIFSVIFISLAIHPGGVARFSKTPFLMADRHGMYLKHRMAGTIELGANADSENAKRKNGFLSLGLLSLTYGLRRLLNTG